MTSFCYHYNEIWTDFTYYSNVSIADFEQINTVWERKQSMHWLETCKVTTTELRPCIKANTRDMLDKSNYIGIKVFRWISKFCPFCNPIRGYTIIIILGAALIIPNVINENFDCSNFQILVKLSTNLKTSKYWPI